MSTYFGRCNGIDQRNECVDRGPWMVISWSVREVSISGLTCLPSEGPISQNTVFNVNAA